MEKGLYLGLMSGTSMDAIDAAVVRCGPNGATLLHHHQEPIPDGVRAQIHQLSHSGPDEIEQLGRLDRNLGALFARASLELLSSAGLNASDIRAIGSHGQTLRHRPPSAGYGNEAFSLQAGDPNTIAELTQITTVADFRRRDIAAGGEGAPLAPAFHAQAFGAADKARAVVNIGGIANVSLLQGHSLLAGFDTGPGNTLMDHWIDRHQGMRFDASGAWGARGQVNLPLLEALLSDPYFGRKGARSTGKEVFNLGWLEHHLQGLPAVPAEDVQATLCQLTATTIVDAIQASHPGTREIYVCGGGAHNPVLLQRIANRMPSATVTDTSALGIEPDWVEAAMFGWLAHCSLAGLAGNATAATGAAGPRVLGGVYPAR